MYRPVPVAAMEYYRPRADSTPSAVGPDNCQTAQTKIRQVDPKKRTSPFI